MTPTPLAHRIRLGALMLPLLCAACAHPALQAPASEQQPPALTATAAIMDDGYRLPLRRWGSTDGALVMLLAVHGFNDYGNGFARLGSRLATRGALTYAYDQRGFGATVQRGRWAGSERMLRDLFQLAKLLRRRHPRLPLYLLGESMGGALVMVAATRGSTANGFILLAPAVWSRDGMNPLLRLALWIGAHSLPWLELTGEGVDIQASDNWPMLRAFGADPLVIKETRIDALWGVTNLMDRAKASASGLRSRLLLLYGEHDEVIPPHAFCALLDGLPDPAVDRRLVLYRNGWHMLARDLQGHRVIDDVASWLSDRGRPMPSGEETGLSTRRIQDLCDR